MKYTEGMRVRCLTDYHAGRQFTAGKEYVIRVDDDEDCRVIADDSGGPNGWNGEFFEIVAPAFKVGGRVRFTDKCPTYWWFGPHTEFKDGVVKMVTDFDRVDTVTCGNGKQAFIINQDEIEPVAVAPQPQRPALPLTIQAGKFYKTRDGRKVGPMEENGSFDEEAFIEVDNDGRGWSLSGTAIGGNHVGDEDIIAEWVDKPAVEVAAPVAEQPAAKPKFKVGDVVVATMNDYDIRKGSQYVVIEVDEHDDIMPIQVNDDDDCPWWMTTGRFELVTPSVTSTPAIVCLMENGRPLPAERPHVHPSTSAAEREASRLADLHKGKEFAVFELGSSCRKEPEYAHEWQRLAAAGNRLLAIKELRVVAGLGLATAKRAVEDWIDREAA